METTLINPDHVEIMRIDIASFIERANRDGMDPERLLREIAVIADDLARVYGVDHPVSVLADKIADEAIDATRPWGRRRFADEATKIADALAAAKA